MRCVIMHQSDEISCGEDVAGVDCVLEAFQNVNSCVSDAARHEFFPELAHAVMMGDGAAVFQDLVPCGILNLSVDCNWIGQALIDESEIDVNTRSCIIDLDNN